MAITVRPCMSMPGAPPRIRSMRSTVEAAIRRSISCNDSFLVVGRSPLIRTLPAAPAKPRTLSPCSRLKPGRRVIMSSAVLGWAAAKNSGA
uniref:hypothetical protein n=1 Tax=uncultured Caulobacter sp. TaxID=158749 RepID=UPI0025D4A69A|nr:hypothetical protein [uncultured Caulobacter sp.]